VKKKSITYWLVEKERPLAIQFLAFVAFFVLFYFLLGSIEGTIALMLGMYLHELGHFLVFVNNKVKTLILFIFPLGAMAVPENEEENHRSDQLPWWNIATLLQAGVTANVILMILGVAMARFGIWPALGKQLVSINGALAIFNLLPIWIIDGGQLFKVIFASLDDTHDRIFSSLGLLVSICILVGIFFSPISAGLLPTLAILSKNSALIIFILLFVFGLQIKHKTDNPEHCSSLQAMSTKQVVLQLAWYFSLVISSLLLLNLPL
jgi:Zn-dependent protease